MRTMYTEYRVTWLRDIEVPAHITEPAVFESCAEWNCSAWSHEACGNCSIGGDK